MIRQGRRQPKLGPVPMEAFKEETETEKEKWESWLAKCQPDCMLITALLSLLPHAPPATQFIAGGWDIARRFIRKVDDFESQGKPSIVKVGFHYTSSEGNRIEEIQRHGLLPSADSRFFGRGVYLCENPHAFSTYGDVGILVLYIPGMVCHLKNNEKCINGCRCVIDSFRGNKVLKGFWTSEPQNYFDEIIVKHTAQVLPVFAFPRFAVNNGDHLFYLQKTVQELIDRTMNYGYRPFRAGIKKTVVRRVYPKFYDLTYEHLLYKRARISLRAPTSLLFLEDGRVVQKSTFSQNAP